MTLNPCLSFPTHWEVITAVYKETKAFKETAKIVANFCVIAGQATQLGIISAWGSIVELPGSINYFVQGKFREANSTLRTAGAVTGIVAAILGFGKALDSLFACMGWVSQGLGAIPVIGPVLASTPFGMIMSIVVLPVSILSLAEKVRVIVENDSIDGKNTSSYFRDWNQLKKNAHYLEIAVEITKIIGSILVIVGIAASITALSIVGTVVAIVGSFCALAAVYQSQFVKTAKLPDALYVPPTGTTATTLFTVTPGAV